MSSDFFDLNGDVNFTKASGVVFQLDEGVIPVGRPKSKVFVFDEKGRNLKYALDEHEQIGLKDRLMDKMNKTQYFAIAATTLTKNLRFKSDFNFGDLKVPDVIVEAKLKSKAPDDIAIAFAEGGDPVKDICYTIRTRLSRVFTEIRLESLDNLQIFHDGVFHRVEEMRVDDPYLSLEGVSVRLTLPKDIEQAFEEIHKQRIEQKKVKERAEREYEELKQQQKLKELASESELKLKELQLERLGITDIRIRLLMTDPEKRAQYLDELYKLQMDQLRESREQASELLKMKRDIIHQHFKAISSDMTDSKQVEKILKLLDESGAAFPRESLLGTVVTVDKVEILPKTTEPIQVSSAKQKQEDSKLEEAQEKSESK